MEKREENLRKDLGVEWPSVAEICSNHFSYFPQDFCCGCSAHMSRKAFSNCIEEVHYH